MTIHSDWSRLFHEECPDAFRTHPPKGHHVGIIDGHLQLMSLHKALPSWEAFMQYLFVKPTLQLFAAGCPRVVLCFDCYNHVPVYKSMTQLKRVHHHTAARKVCTFNPDHGLPAHIPEDPMLYLMNHDFKIKLVEMLCERVPPMVQAQMPAEREFIIDYKRVVLYSSASIPRVMTDLVPMGESDVKFCRYVDLYGNALVHAIDGDYLAIALLYYTQRPLGANNSIYIYRQLSTFPTGAPKPAVKKKVVKCWVNIQMLYLTITHAVWQSAGSAQTLCNLHTRAPFSNADAVQAAVFLMLLAGTDFSRSLPWLGPKRLWDHLPNVIAPLMQAVATADTDDKDTTSSMLADLVIAKLYRLVFAKHCSAAGTNNSLRHVMSNLLESKLSPGIKSKLPLHEQVVTTIQNVFWVMAYWKTHNDIIATPLDGTCGFVRSASQVTFADLAV
jgi:hypothetical protein